MLRRAAKLRNAAAAWLAIKRLEQQNPLAARLVGWAGRDNLPVKQLTDTLRDEIGRNGVEASIEAGHAALAKLRAARLGGATARNLHTALCRALSFDDLQAAIDFGEAYANLGDKRLMRSLVTFHRRAGNFVRALDLLAELEPDDWREATRAELQKILDMQALRANHTEIETALADGADAVRAVAEQLSAEIDRDTVTMMLFLASRTEFRKASRLAEIVIELGEEVATHTPRPARLAFDMCDAHLHLGNITGALDVLDRLGGDEDLAAKRERVAAFDRLRREGFTHQVTRDVPDEWQADPARVLVPLHNSLPHDSGGYASRTHGLLSNIHALGWRISGVTRLGYPQDRKKHRAVTERSSSGVDDITYFRLRKEGKEYGRIPIYEYLCEYADALYQLAARERPEVIYAPSNYMNGIAANAVGRALGIKTIYEVRGLWEITRISRQATWEGTEYFEMMSRMELQAAREADAVTCITSALKDEMVARGVPAEKISIIPNGVDTERFVPRPRDEALARALGLHGKRVIGYIGSVVDYEGLDDLLRAVALLEQRDTPDFGVLIVGDGAVLDDIKALAAELGIEHRVVFTGRVPHAEVESYYSIIDVAPFPRKSLPVTEMVSPLKPFEAMAMEKIVLASSVAALDEIVSEGVNGYLFEKGNIDDLADKLAFTLTPEAARGLRAREWVIENRDWKTIAAIADGVFKRLTSRFEPAPQLMLNQIELTPEVSDILDAYTERYSESSPAHVRRDDYARWSEVSRRVAHETTLLDVGIGIGQFVNAMARRGTFERIVGVDKSQHTLFVRLSDGFDLDMVSIHALPYADGEFDVVTCMETIEHLPESIFVAGIEQLRRVCAKQLIITVPFREERLSKGHLRRFDFDDIERLFPDAEVTLFRKSSRSGTAHNYWALIEERY